MAVGPFAKRRICVATACGERSVEHIEAQLEGVQLPVHVLSIAGDPIAPPGACDELLRLVPEASVTRHRVSAVASHPLWRRHFSWAREPSDVAPTIARVFSRGDAA